MNFLAIVMAMVMAIFMTLSQPSFAIGPLTGCRELLSRYQNNNTDRTQSFITYLETLHATGVISEDGLRLLISKVSEGVLTHPVLPSSVKTSYQAESHFFEIDTYIQNGNIQISKVVAWVEDKLAIKTTQRHQRLETQGDTEEVGRYDFYRIEGGIFEVGGDDSRHQVKLTRAIEVMSKPVTHLQWAELMEDVPTLEDSTSAEEMMLNGKVLRQRFDHPVNRITWLSALEFANRLSKKHGYRPVYNLERLRKRDQAEDGTLTARSGEIEIIAEDQNVYATNGYRLPTRAEQEFLLSQARTQEGKPFSLDQLGKYAWFAGNSNNSTQPVASKAPLLIQGKEFFDLFGNVWEMSSDWANRTRKKWNPDDIETDPFDPINRQRNLMLGGSYEDLSGAEFSRNIIMEFDYISPSIGFRLVRTVQ